VRQKGFDRLVTACRYLAQEGFSFHHLILGGGAVPIFQIHLGI